MLSDLNSQGMFALWISYMYVVYLTLRIKTVNFINTKRVFSWSIEVNF